MAAGRDWSEAEYAEYLDGERRLFAWVMRNYGNMTHEDADAAALVRYPYESPGAYRGLIFHDEPWHWGMLALEGEGYGIRRPDLVNPPQVYREL